MITQALPRLSYARESIRPGRKRSSVAAILAEAAQLRATIPQERYNFGGENDDDGGDTAISERRAYAQTEWLDGRVERRASSIAGQGLFARARIAAGEPLIRWGGTVFTQDEVEAGKAEGTVAINEHLYLGDPAGTWDRERNDVGDFINHSCDGNLWMADEVTLVARSAIVADEELTIDYALFKSGDSTVARFVCHCGSPLCRKRVTGRDWRLPELQGRYSGHFSPFLNRRIARRAAHDGTHL